MKTRFELDRRGLLTGITLLTAASVADKASAAAPEAAMRTLARLQGDLSGRITFGYQRGRVFGLRPGAGLPLADYGMRLYDYEGGSVARTRVLDNGDIETRSRGWLFYTDPETGDYLETWRNPVTGKTVPVPPFRGGIGGSVLTPNGPRVNANFTMESTVFDSPVVLETVTMGGSSWLTRHAFTRWVPKGASQARTEFTLDVWTLPTRALLDTRTSHLPATSSWTSQTEWQTWLEMPADYAGAQLWHADGKKAFRIADLPPGFVARSNLKHPGILSDPLEFDATQA
jgi:Protein of unknown function (DUF1838)